MSDPAAAYDRLRAETAEMFGYDLGNLSLTQGLQLDLVSLLRLEVDTMQGQVLAGQVVDLTRLVAAHGMLQKLLPERALVAPAPAVEDRGSPTARERLRQLIENVFAAKDAELAESCQREEAVMAAEAMSASPPPPEPPPEPPEEKAPSDERVVPFVAVRHGPPPGDDESSEGWSSMRAPWRPFTHRY